MKSNFMEVFNDVFPGFKNRGVFCVDDLVDSIMPRLEFQDVSEDEKDRFIVKTRLEALLSAHDCFSYSKNNFVLLDAANLEKLHNIDDDFAKDIEGREKTLERIRAKEKEIEGQMEMIPTDSGSMKIEERKTLLERLTG